MVTSKKTDEHSFSIEMKSEKSVQKMSFADKEDNHIFFEGSLGKLTNIFMVEGMMLQIEGINGTLRMDISKEELQNCFKNKSPLEAKEQ
jgi:hypothetical protein